MLSCEMLVFLFFFWTTCFCSKAAAIYTAEIVSVLPDNLPIGSSLHFTGPGLEFATENVNRKYYPFLQIVLTYIYNASDRTCDEATSTVTTQLPQRYYDARDDDCCLAIIGASCGGQTVAPLLAAGWDVLLFSPAVAPTEIFNKEVTPTSIPMVGTYRSFGQAALKLTESFRWRHISVLLDRSIVSTDFYRLLANEIMSNSLAGNTSLVAVFDFYGTDGASTAKSMKSVQSRSRVIFILSDTKTALKVLKVGRTLNISCAEYAFIVVQPVQSNLYGHVEWFDHPSSEEAEIYRTVIVITTRMAEAKYRPLGEKLAELSRQLYNATYENGSSPFDQYTIRETFNSVEIFAALVNETLDFVNTNKTDRRCSGRFLHRSVRNRTFNLTLGRTYVDEHGSRPAELRVFTFNNITRKMQLSASYNPVSRSYVWLDNEYGWRTESYDVSVGWPPDTPRCGFSELEGPCLPVCQLSQNNGVIIVVPVITLAAAAFLIAVLVLRRQVMSNRLNSEWWLITSRADLRNINRRNSKRFLFSNSQRMLASKT